MEVFFLLDFNGRTMLTKHTKDDATSLKSCKVQAREDEEVNFGAVSEI